MTIILLVRCGHPLSGNILAVSGQEIANTEDPYPVASAQYLEARLEFSCCRFQYAPHFPCLLSRRPFSIDEVFIFYRYCAILIIASRVSRNSVQNGGKFGKELSLASFQLLAKSPNLSPRQIFPLYGSHICVCVYVCVCVCFAFRQA